MLYRGIYDVVYSTIIIGMFRYIIIIIYEVPTPKDIFTLTKGRMILRIHSPLSRSRLGFGFFGAVHTRCSRLAYKSSSNHEREARAVDCLFTFLCFLWQKRARDLTGANYRNRK